MALTAPQEADIEESLSNVTELGRFCTITCTDDNAKTKGNLFEHASKYNMAIVFPDTSARGVDIGG